MTIHVNIGEDGTKLTELVAAALRGEEVVLNRAGLPVAAIVPRPEAGVESRQEIGRRRREYFGKHRGEFSEEELTLPDERVDDYLDERFERKFGAPSS